MGRGDRIAVTSRSFSQHAVLRAELLALYDDVRFNDAGEALRGTDLVEFLRGSDKAITALEPIDAALLDQVPELKVVSKVGVGLDMIDLDALKQRDVLLSWTPGTNSRSVAELTIALALALRRRLFDAVLDVRSREWRQVKGRTLSGCTVGIVGFGAVGADVARLLEPFDCRILAHDLPSAATRIADAGATAMELDELLAQSDVVTLHVGLDDTTRSLLDARRLALLKQDAVLINTARGGLIDEAALKEMLRDGRLAGAALDALEREPPEEDDELLRLPNVIVTPHIGGSTEEAILAMGRAAIAGLQTARPVEDLG
jgi:phosphoglycerate dehydrogenase-like enzyme